MGVGLGGVGMEAEVGRLRAGFRLLNGDVNLWSLGADATLEVDVSPGWRF